MTSNKNSRLNESLINWLITRMLLTLSPFCTSNKANSIAFHFEESVANYYRKIGRNKNNMQEVMRLGHGRVLTSGSLHPGLYVLTSPAEMLCGNFIGSLSSTSSFQTYQIFQSLHSVSWPGLPKAIQTNPPRWLPIAAEMIRDKLWSQWGASSI